MIRKNLRWMAVFVLATNLGIATPSPLLAAGGRGNEPAKNNVGGSTTSTPIKHVVVIFQENVSFDHYFGTYPHAANKSEEVQFRASANTPTVNGLTEGLIGNNNNQDKNGIYYAPVRLDPTQNYTCDQNHDYTPEQQAFDSGLMDRFPEFTATACSDSPYSDVSKLGAGIVMGYYDGNTVTGLWNYAQHYALNDYFFGTNFGPSTPGAINVISGMTGGGDPNANLNAVADGDAIETNGQITVIGDSDPYYDDCSSTTERIGMLSTNQNIGTLLTANDISWGWFQGGFTPSTAYTPATTTSPAIPAACTTTTPRIDGTQETAYSPHHNPFQYYGATSNPHHLPPTSVAEIGNNGQANHIYDLSWFQTAALAGNLPAVSYLKANRAQDGHPGNSSPLDEQVFIVDTLNFLQSLPDWNQTAVIITWDDSDGWYDHVIAPIMNQSNTTKSSLIPANTANPSPFEADALTGTGLCGSGLNSLAGLQARCGYGPRIPLLVISPYAKKNFVDHTLTDQSSVVRFIEDNWSLPQIDGSFDGIAGSLLNMFDFKNQRSDQLLLNPATGQVAVQ
ncbi:MAG: alkaline phosphatase family protein [Candidatus Acidiferrales bacterium]|jgi:phospholipase C